MYIRIAIASHKEYAMPDDRLYVPVLAGAERIHNVDDQPDLSHQPHSSAALPDGWMADDDGENISALNSEFCELTVLYWMWKNPDKLEGEYLGLCHYRRLFGNPGNNRRMLLGRAEAEYLAASNDVILPRCRNYLIETNYSQFVHAHGPEPLDMTRRIIGEKYPGYLESYDKIMSKRTGHRFNMFIMKRELMDEYCCWLFDILFELRERLAASGRYEADGIRTDIPQGYSSSRMMGYVGERLLDVWLDAGEYSSAEVPYIFTEKENLLLKGIKMAWRKLRHLID